MNEGNELARIIGNRIRKIRTSRGMSIEKLALECKMSPNFLGHVERGLRSPTIHTLERICAGLGIGISELFPDDLAVNHTAGNESAAEHLANAIATLTPLQQQQVCRIVDDIIKML
jgi:transcriptional regulator with XRE-family HTH domain